MSDLMRNWEPEWISGSSLKNKKLQNEAKGGINGNKASYRG